MLFCGEGNVSSWRGGEPFLVGDGENLLLLERE